jgi:hypothetical protein
VRPVIILLALSCSLASGQGSSELRLAPPRPVEGRALSLQYRPAKEFSIARVESVVVEILAAGSSSRVYDVTLRPSGRLFTGTWTVPPGTSALFMRVAVADRVDDRGATGWGWAVLRPDGSAMPGAEGWLIRAAAPGGLFGFRARLDAPSSNASPSEDIATPEEQEWRLAVAHRDASERWRALARYLEKHPGTTEESKVQVLVRSAIAAGAWDAADELIHRQPRKEPMWLIALAEGLMQANVTIDRASVLAKESVNAARNWDPARKPPLLSLREFRDQRASEVPLALHTYARSLVKLGYPAIAEKVYSELNELLGGNDSDVRNEYAAVRRSLGKDPHPPEPERSSHR